MLKSCSNSSFIFLLIHLRCFRRPKRDGGSRENRQEKRKIDLSCKHYLEHLWSILFQCCYTKRANSCVILLIICRYILLISVNGGKKKRLCSVSICTVWKITLALDVRFYSVNMNEIDSKRKKKKIRRKQATRAWAARK